MLGKLITFPLTLIKRLIGLVSGILKTGIALIAAIVRFIVRRLFGTVFGAVIGLIFGSKGIGIHLPWSQKKKQ